MLEQEAGSVKLQERRVQVFRQALHYLQQYRLMHNFNKSTKKPRSAICSQTRWPTTDDALQQKGQAHYIEATRARGEEDRDSHGGPPLMVRQTVARSLPRPTFWRRTLTVSRPILFYITDTLANSKVDKT